MSYNAEIQSNNADLQTILDKVNALPEAGESENLDDEIAQQTTALDTQAALISQLRTVLEGKASGGSTAYETCTLRIASTGDNAALREVGCITLASDGTLRPYLWSSLTETQFILQSVVVGMPCWILVYSASGSYDITMTNATEIDGTYSHNGQDESASREFFVCTTPSEETVIEYMNVDNPWG